MDDSAHVIFRPIKRKMDEYSSHIAMIGIFIEYYLEDKNKDWTK
jgi:hypothetical protein